MVDKLELVKRIVRNKKSLEPEEGELLLDRIEALEQENASLVALVQLREREKLAAVAGRKS